MTGSTASHTLSTGDLLAIRAGVENALKNAPANPILQDMLRLLNHITATPDLFGDVCEFLGAFGQDYDGPPRVLPDDLQRFRIDHMREELNEYEDGAALAQSSARAGDSTHMHTGMEDQLDACVDLVYVTLQSARKQGFNFYEAWRRVHIANMAKEAHPEGKGGIRKPPGWIAPDLSDLVYTGVRGVV